MYGNASIRFASAHFCAHAHFPDKYPNEFNTNEQVPTWVGSHLEYLTGIFIHVNAFTVVCRRINAASDEMDKDTMELMTRHISSTRFLFPINGNMTYRGKLWCSSVVQISWRILGAIALLMLYLVRVGREGLDDRICILCIRSENTLPSDEK